MDEPLESEAQKPDDDLAAYIAALQSGPVSPRPPIVVSDISMPPLTQFFNDPPASTNAPGVSAGPVIPAAGTLITTLLCKHDMLTGINSLVYVQVPTFPAP